MQAAPERHDEAAAQAALRALEVLDTPPEAEFDALVRVASAVCGVPVSLISLIDAERQWFKAQVGLPGVTETPREAAFCAHAVLAEEIFEVVDAEQDPRFADNPLVAGEPHIRFYAGAPLRLASGHRVGTLCVIDRQPRRLTEGQREILQQLAIAAGQALEGRRALRQVRQMHADALRASLALRHTADAVIGLSPKGHVTRWNDAAQRLFGHDPTGIIGRSVQTLVPASAAPQALDPPGHFESLTAATSFETVLSHQDGSPLDVEVTRVPQFDAHGELVGITQFVRGIGARKQAERLLAASQAGMRLVMDSVPSMLAFWDADLICGFANRAYEDWFGADPGALVGTHLRDLLGPELFIANKPFLEAALAGREQTFERSLETPAGDLRHSLASYLPHVVDGRVAGVLVQVNDVTELKRSEIALREQVAEREALNTLLVRSADALARAQRLGRIGSWEWTMNPDTTVWSDEMFRIVGLEPEGPSPNYEAHAQVYLPASWARLQGAVGLALQTGEPYVLDLEFELRDGRRGWVEARGEVVRDDSGQVCGLRGTAQDVTETRRLTAEVARQHELLRVTLQSIGDAVITTDDRGVINWLNPVAERLTGWLSDEAQGRPLTQVFNIVDEETRQPADDPVAACLAQRKVVGLAQQVMLIARNGSEYGIEDSAAPICNAEGTMLGAVLVFHDVTEQRRLSGEMSYRATHDALTGLVNRAEFENRLRRSLNRSQEDRSEHALLYIDLDQFKLVNDACGHAVGDQLLQQVAKLLGETVRLRDTLARLGGDEFAVILEHCTGEQAQRVAQQVCDRMDDFRFMHDGRRFRIGTSIGLVPVDARWASTAAILQAADTSCYAAKEAGRNRVHAWFDTDRAMRTRHGEMQWASRIETALDEDRFVLFAQRVVALDGGGQGLHAEVLLRLKERDGTLVPPGAFLPAAERFNMASRIDRWVLKHVVDWMHALPGLQAVGMLSVNLSGQSVGDRAFHRWAVELLAEAGAPVCSRLCLEITETAAVTNFADATVFIDQVRSAGVRVALDDFGAGASSFGYLKSLPVDFLKIDGQFVRDLITDPLDEAAVRCFADVAKVVGVKSVAEFVETAEVLQRLREIGVDFAQGYLLHKPAPLDDLLGAGVPNQPARVG